MSLAESALGGRLGAEVDLRSLPVVPGPSLGIERLLFSETPSRFLVSVSPDHEARWAAVVAGAPCARVGEVRDHAEVRLRDGGRPVAACGLSEISAAWKGRAP